MDQWYMHYFSQTWYANTFLVKRPSQIAHINSGIQGGWNNIYDSGCHFTCLAMMLNIDPGRLASELRNKKYFYADENFPSERLNGVKGGLVWDRNAPHAGLESVLINNFWHITLERRISLELRYIGTTSTIDYEQGCEEINAIRSRGNHVICGPEEHSFLAAGETCEGYYVWDPDGSETTVEQNLEGAMTLRNVFNAYPGHKIEFWEYCVVVT